MMVFVGLMVSFIGCYLLGSVNTSIIITRILGSDIRNEGSGNAGATNMLRSHGIKMGVVTLFLDMIKGILAVLFCLLLSHIVMRFVGGVHGAFTAREALSFQNPDALWLYSYRYIGAIGVVIGHDFPIYFGFRGGKGVATSLGVVLMLDVRIALVTLLIAVMIMAISLYVSLGSVLAPIIYTILVSIYSGFISHLPFNYMWLIFSLVMCLLIIVKHRRNIERLFNHTESKLGVKGTKTNG